MVLLRINRFFKKPFVALMYMTYDIKVNYVLIAFLYVHLYIISGRRIRQWEIRWKLVRFHGNQIV